MNVPIKIYANDKIINYMQKVKANEEFLIEFEVTTYLEKGPGPFSSKRERKKW